MRVYNIHQQEKQHRQNHTHIINRHQQHQQKAQRTQTPDSTPPDTIIIQETRLTTVFKTLIISNHTLNTRKTFTDLNIPYQHTQYRI